VASTLFERHGYEAVTMEQIAAEADVARGTLYNHFAVKEAVLAAWMHVRLADDLAPLMERVMTRKAFVSRVRALLDASAQWWVQHRQYAAPYVRFRFQELREGRSGNTSSSMITAYEGLITEAQAAGDLRNEQSAERMANYLHFLYLYALLAWIGNAKVSLREEFRQAFEFFMQGAARR
jgi:AcrR family transcriptional regulator